jgi:hypothetical protein
MKKNMLRGWIPTVGLVAVMTFGATFANAGTIVEFRDDGSNSGCSDTSKEGTIVEGLAGTIVEGFAGTIVEGFAGTIVEGFAGTIVEGKLTSAPCTK